MKKTACILVVAVSLAFPAAAQLSNELRDWARGPVSHLMTDQEKAEWGKIRTDEEAQNFIDLFWARRDPTPGTAFNEMKVVFEQRVAIADERFTSGRTKGSMTDRGRTLILLGAPYRIARTALEPTSTHQSGVSAGGASARGEGAPSEVWYYERTARPVFAGNIDFDVSFIDYYGTDDYKLVVSGRRGVNDLLLQARDYYIAQPDLQAVPDYALGADISVPTVDTVVVEEVSTEFTRDYLRAAYEEFRRNAAEQQSGLHVTYGEYITPQGTYFVPVQLYIPASAGLDAAGDLTFFGVVETQEGEIVAVFEEPATLIASNRDRYFDTSLMVAPGTYTGTFGIVRGEEPVAIASTELKLEGLSPDQPSISDLLLSSNIYVLEEAQKPTDPFAFGGMKVVPKGDRTFSTSEEMWYFVELRNPGLNDESEPKVRVQLEVEGERSDGTPVKMAAPMMEAQLQEVKDVPGHYVTGSSFPAGAFAPGSYTLKARIFDANLRKTYNLEREFRITD
jgi:GWxTD domain-containing protein